MQVEVLKFLLDAHAHLQTMPRESDTEHLDDLQAVDRVLPDCDWFELADEPRAAARGESEPLAAPRFELEF